MVSAQSSAAPLTAEDELERQTSIPSYVDAGPTIANLESLEAWFLAQGGVLHKSLRLTPAGAGAAGVSISIKDGGPLITPNTTLLCSPFSTTVSILSIPQIAPFWPIEFFNALAPSALPVLARFTVIEAWLQGEKSPWWPYFRALPQPTDLDNAVDAPFDTPLYWNADDRLWLKGTRLETATQERESTWREELSRGKCLLRDSAISEKDRERWSSVQPRMWEAYSWPLYLWATTLLTTRCFPSKLLSGWQPDWDEDSSWGRCPMAREWREGSSTHKFPVLFPVLDLTNHNPRAKVAWEVNGVDLQFITHEKLSGGEMFNNYGPKPNDELIMGYGFLLEHNEDDQVTISAVTRTETSVEPQATEMTSTSNETVLAETRGLRKIAEDEDVAVAYILRGALSLTQAYQLAVQLANPRELLRLTSSRDTASFLPLSPTRNFSLLADRTRLALERYLDRLNDDAPNKAPQNHRQQMAASFRQGQADIVEANMDRLDDFLIGLQKQGYILTLSQILADKVSPEGVRRPLRAILKHRCGVEPRARSVTAHGGLEFAFVIWLCLLLLRDKVIRKSGSSALDASMSSSVERWINFVQQHYNDILHGGAADTPTAAETGPFAHETEDAAQSYVAAIHDFVAEDAEGPRSVFDNAAWTQPLVAAATQIWRYESVAFESMDRLVWDGREEVHEEFLFIEHPE